MRIVGAVLLAAFVAGCGSRQPSDLAGNWEIVLPAGFSYQSRIERIGDARYRIPSIANLSGVYERRGDSLFVVEPNDSRLTEFIWEIQDIDHRVLVQSPHVGKIGSDYTGATLRRLK